MLYIFLFESVTGESFLTYIAYDELLEVDFEPQDDDVEEDFLNNMILSEPLGFLCKYIH